MASPSPFADILTYLTVGLDVRIWEVGAGLAIRIKTPNGQNHLIDAGAGPDFSPALHIAFKHWNVTSDRLDVLLVSHFDKDHLEDLPNVIDYLGEPRFFYRNRSVPEVEKYGPLGYQLSLENLDSRYVAPIQPYDDPMAYQNNGGVFVEHYCNRWDQISGTSSPSNNASIVIAYTYMGVTFVFPGDIENEGWLILRDNNPTLFSRTFDQTKRLILLAPHHGRTSGFSQDMIDYLKPELVVISDGYGAGPTDRRFQSAGSGLFIDGELKHFITTKNKGRKKITVSLAGGITVHEFDD